VTTRLAAAFLLCAAVRLHAGSRSDVLRLFPDSGLADGFGSTACTTDFRPSGSTWAPGLDEHSVFHALLEHKNNRDRSWQLRVGKGGQIYSLIGPFGESMPPQFHKGAPWIDEVWQVVSVCGKLNNHDLFRGRGRPAAYFIHGAGVYLRDRRLKKPFYSPVLASSYDPRRRSLAMVNWGQHAHVPTIHRSGVLYYTEYRDLGDGVIEVTYVIHSFGTDTLDYLNIPWGGVRRSALPVHLLSRPDGSAERLGGSFGSRRGPPTIRDAADTGGWAAFAQDGESPDRFALALVFGRDRHRAEKPDWQPLSTRWRWGVAGLEERRSPRDYLVATVNSRCVVAPGETFGYRLYFVIGPLRDVMRQGRTLVAHVDYGIVPLLRKDAPIVRATIGARQPFFLWGRPVPGSTPIFLLRDTTTRRLLVTHDPYQLASTAPFENPYPEGHAKHDRYANRRVLRPYDGRTEYVALLGFGLREGAPSDTLIRLADVVTDRTLFPTPTPEHGKLLVPSSSN
jgi:hypothetical protein